MKSYVVMKNQKNGKNLKIPIGPNMALVMVPLGLLGIVWQVVYLQSIGGAISGAFFGCIIFGLVTGLEREASVGKKIAKLRKKGLVPEGAVGERAERFLANQPQPPPE